MLASQHLGRSHQDSLVSAIGKGGHQEKRHNRLTAADIALHEGIDALPAPGVLNHGINRCFLVCGQFVRQALHDAIDCTQRFYGKSTADGRVPGSVLVVQSKIQKVIEQHTVLPLLNLLHRLGKMQVIEGFLNGEQFFLRNQIVGAGLRGGLRDAHSRLHFLGQIFRTHTRNLGVDGQDALPFADFRLEQLRHRGGVVFILLVVDEFGTNIDIAANAGADFIQHIILPEPFDQQFLASRLDGAERNHHGRAVVVGVDPRYRGNQAGRLVLRQNSGFPAEIVVFSRQEPHEVLYGVDAFTVELMFFCLHNPEVGQLHDGPPSFLSEWPVNGA